MVGFRNVCGFPVDRGCALRDNFDCRDLNRSGSKPEMPRMGETDDVNNQLDQADNPTCSTSEGASSIRRALEAFLSRRFGAAVSVLSADRFGPSHVYCCALNVSGGDLPASIIVRTPRVGEVR